MKAQIRKDLDKFDLPRWEWRIVNEATNEVVHVSERWCGTEEQAITQARAALGHEVDGWTDIEP